MYPENVSKKCIARIAMLALLAVLAVLASLASLALPFWKRDYPALSLGTGVHTQHIPQGLAYKLTECLTLSGRLTEVSEEVILKY
jgi:hypothetical protein